MSCTRNEIVKQAQSWVGLKESDGSFKKIIDLYNTLRPLPRGYKLQYTDAWCAGFVSALAAQCKATDIIPTEVSCPRMITLAKNMGIWAENDAHTPQPGDIMMYDWDDSGKGDNSGEPEHVGIVEKISGSSVTVIEGNYSNAVKRRSMQVNGRYIRGYIVPRYDADTGAVRCKVELPQLERGCVGAAVKAMQLLLIGGGFSCGKWGADGEFGSDTLQALKRFQTARGLAADGICGVLTWTALLDT